MMHGADLPAWAEVVVAVFVLAGAALTLIGAIGLVRLRTFYERVHAPTLGTTLGIGCLLLASMLFFTLTQGRLVLHEVLIGVFMVLTMPVSTMLLARAALYRDRQENLAEVPPLPVHRPAVPVAPDAHDG
jgi:multicomponent K+:H+ antiporter subunit G